MTLKRKTLPLAVCGVGLLLGAGCSGLNASHSVSPASFFLPGLLKAEPPPTPTAPTSPVAPELQPGGQVAQAS